MNPTPTTIVISDPVILAQLTQATGQIEFKDPAGNVVATVETVSYGVPPPGFKVPFSEEEMERRRQERTGRPLADILRDLRQGGGK
jgi:hypothetical protein